MKSFLEIRNLAVAVSGKQIIKDVNLKLTAGEIHILLGPNGAGKTTLALAMAGHPHYYVKGEIILNGSPIQKLSPDQRARLGIFLCFQRPVEIPGVTLRNILRKVSPKGDGPEEKSLQALKINPGFLSRSFEGFSSGEGKKLELFQAEVLKKKFLLVDEIDSGLDLDNLKLVTDDLGQLAKSGAAILLITHNLRILKLIKPSRIHVLVKGTIRASAGLELAKKIEKEGYLWLSKKRD
jgi:Fe-S cluster assembly ATP-binding protein